MAAGKRCALIVAGYEYQDPGLSGLRAPAHDAAALASVLHDPRVGDFEVETLVNESSAEVRTAVAEFFSDRSSDDLLLLHFSCHGVKDVNGDLYFATADTQIRLLAATAVAAEFVNMLMHRCRARRIVLLLDCCYAGAFERGMVPRGDRNVGIGDRFEGRGRAVITASNAVEYAFEGSTLTDLDSHRPSYFTDAVVRALRTGEADTNGDGFISVDELYDYVFDRVREQTSHQTPGKWTYAVQGDLFIARSVREPTGSARPFPAYGSSAPATRPAESHADPAQSAPDTAAAAAAAGRTHGQAATTPGSRVDSRWRSRPARRIAAVGIAVVAAAAGISVPVLDSGAGNAKASSTGTSAPPMRSTTTPSTSAGPPIGTTVFQDDFTDHSQWPDDGNYAAQGGGGRYADGGYVVYAAPVANGGYEGHSPTSAAGPVYPEAPADISVSVEAREISTEPATNAAGEATSGYGVECHSGQSLSGYVFSIWNTSASIEKLTAAGTDTPLTAPVVPNAIKVSGTNHLAVACVDSASNKSVDLEFWVNGKLVADYTDASSPLLTGSIALVAGTGSTAPKEPIEVQFNDLLVQRL